MGADCIRPIWNVSILNPKFRSGRKLHSIWVMWALLWFLIFLNFCWRLIIAALFNRGSNSFLITFSENLYSLSMFLVSLMVILPYSLFWCVLKCYFSGFIISFPVTFPINYFWFHKILLSNFINYTSSFHTEAITLVNVF